jgi:hypothetical protein
MLLLSTDHEKTPEVEWRLWCGAEGMFTNSKLEGCYWLEV